MEQGFCPLCLNEEKETVEHVLMACSKYSEFREEFGVALKVLMIEERRERWLKELKDWDEGMMMSVLVGDASILLTEIRATVTNQTEQLLQKIYYKKGNSKYQSTAMQSNCGAHGTMIAMA
eukprot:GCRY01004948.1.p1 GENE.GCRY01004948.1~~GCRY01004948.1.p1  ORF type:complete len:121 (-),score=12.03 GCRY01004948.1:200-562(-)